MDKQPTRYRHLLREAKQQHHLATRADYYAFLSLEKTVGESEIRKAYGTAAGLSSSNSQQPADRRGE